MVNTAKTPAEINPDEVAFLATQMSFNDAIQALTDAGAISEVASFDIIGEGAKEKLVGIPFVITEWRQGKDSDYDNDFVIVTGVTEKNESFLFTDGSTGVAKQLFALREMKGRNTSVLCRNGLVKSTYTYTDEKGKKTPAATYYLS